MLKCNLCNYNDAWILVVSDITTTRHVETKASFKNCASIIKYITKTDIEQQ